MNEGVSILRFDVDVRVGGGEEDQGGEVVGEGLQYRVPVGHIDRRLVRQFPMDGAVPGLRLQ